MEKVWESNDYVIYSDGETYYLYQRQDLIRTQWDLSEFFFLSCSFKECLEYVVFEEAFV